jgi:muramoyltetrapeptide carboxypeptidase
VAEDQGTAVVRPPALCSGDTIALVAPSRPANPHRISTASAWLEKRGYHVRTSPLCTPYHYLAGRDQDRAKEVMDAFLDDGVQALLCVRGGFGTGRILDRLDYGAIKDNPKALIGFSDSTGLQLALLARSGLVSFTGALADSDLGQGSVDPLLAESMWRLLERREALGGLPADSGDALTTICGGCGEGPLVAANLALLCSLLGTPYAPNLDGAVLLIEDVSEAPYRLDRMLTQLRLAGVLDRLSGLALGRFHDCFSPTDMEASPTLIEMVIDALGGRNIPTVSGVAYGHMRRRTVLPIGIPARIDADVGSVTITESAVR